MYNHVYSQVIYPTCFHGKQLNYKVYSVFVRWGILCRYCSQYFLYIVFFLTVAKFPPKTTKGGYSQEIVKSTGLKNIAVYWQVSMG